MEPDLEALRSKKAKSGFKGVTVTTSNKFQARIFIETNMPQLDLGTFDTAEDAARAVATAKEKRKRGDKARDEPVRERAARGTVCCRCPLQPALLALKLCRAHMAGIARRGREAAVGAGEGGGSSGGARNEGGACAERKRKRAEGPERLGA